MTVTEKYTFLLLLFFLSGLPFFSENLPKTILKCIFFCLAGKITVLNRIFLFFDPVSEMYTFLLQDLYFREEIRMLVLGLKVGEYVKIGENVTITVVKDKKDFLRLSIDAPKDVHILRGELIQRGLEGQQTG